MKTIGLCMIVKNEAQVILRALESVRGLVDYVLVQDTGSADETPTIVRDYLQAHGLPGEVFDEPWRDFGHNRSVVLARLRERQDIDYALVMDADQVVVPEQDFDPVAFKKALSKDLYRVTVKSTAGASARTLICSNRLELRYRGVLHEFLQGPSNASSGIAGGFHIRSSREGSRNENSDKNRKNAEILERALQTEQDAFLRSRYLFHLARTYRDLDEKEKALQGYLERATLGFSDEEVFQSFYQAGKLQEILRHPVDEVLATYAKATAACPRRAEALHAASRFCRVHARSAQGYEIAKQGLGLPRPRSGLFIEPWIYEYGLLDEFVHNAFWAGAYQEALDACLKVLARGKLPESIAKRFAESAGFAGSRLRSNQPPNLGTLGSESLADQLEPVPDRSLRSRVKGPPRVLLAILAKQKEHALPLYLECIEALDYPKSSIVLYIRTNNNTDRTAHILREWMDKVGRLYAAVELDASDVAERVERFREHEWNAARVKVLGRIRNLSLKRTLDLGCDFYFVVDVDNFIRPATLRELVALDLPIVAPLLRAINPATFYSNYHAEVDAAGYHKSTDQYHWILNRHVRGIVEVPVVHCTYLVRADVIPELNYEDITARYEYVIFSDSARKAGIPQYLDNRQVYGYITFGEGDPHHLPDGVERARAALRNEHSVHRKTDVATVVAE